MATLTVAPADRAGVTLSGAAAATVSGDAFLNTGREVAVFSNASGSPITITFVSQNTVDGRAVADRTVSIAAGATVAYGPFPGGIYSDTNGLVQMTYSDVTTLTVKVLKVTPE